MADEAPPTQADPGDAIARLAALEHRQALILRALGDGVFGLDAEGRATFVNQAATGMTGWTEADLLGQTIHDIHHHSYADGRPYPSEQCPMYATTRDGQAHQGDDEYFWRKDGTGFPVSYTSTPIFEDGELRGAVVVFRDISQRLQQERELREAMARVQVLQAQLQRENHVLREAVSEARAGETLIGDSPVMQALRHDIARVSPTSAAVLIEGESGCGKELVARAIHAASERAERPLVRVNCGAISAGLVESELFGHERGAFTGATGRRVGRFELADGGTLFLDEIGEMPMEAQVKLLRVLQEGEFERVGGNQTLSSDVRVIAATNRDLAAQVADGRFRADLYYRLNVFPLRVPPLRERREDIPALLAHQLQRLSQRLGKPLATLQSESLTAMRQYDWPGNVRELFNLLERGAILAMGPVLRCELPSVESSTEAPVVTDVEGQARPRTLAEAEREHILATLHHCGGAIAGAGGAAELLALPPSTLRSRMKKLGIQRTLSF